MLALAMPPRPSKPAPLAQPVAFLSDIHGNLPALHAVLSDLEDRDVRSFVVLGDSFLGGDDPQGVFRALARAGGRCLRGASDTALVQIDPASLVAHSDAQEARLSAFRAARASLGDLALHEIRRWPERLRFPLIDGRELLAVHGSPVDPYTDITFDMDEDELASCLDDEVADLVVCGSSHVPFRIPVGSVEVLSVGTVGASIEERVAHFAIIHPRMGEIEITQTYVDY